MVHKHLECMKNERLQSKGGKKILKRKNIVLRSR